MYGLSTEQLAYLDQCVVAPVEQHGGKVWLFGSRARGDQQPYSDVDILIEGDKSQLYNVLSDIREQLEESNFPFAVDLVLAEELAGSYAASVRRDRVQLSVTPAT